jgi:DNA repair protein RadA/Sms
MARASSVYRCQACGFAGPKPGTCPDCKAASAGTNFVQLVEERAEPVRSGRRATVASGRPTALKDVVMEQGDRQLTGIGELDRVLGGGVVPGSAVLIGGDPGIGKSTLLLQAAAALARAGHGVAYLSGEESADQIRLRASRLRVTGAPVRLATATSVRDLLATLDTADAPDVVVIDSVQTVYVDSLESAPGTVAQLRASAHELIRFAKRRGAALFLVGHVTKEGAIAGPRVLEHMVDAVLYFEGERGHQFRILRAVKNRFGAANEIGVFEMRDRGLVEVTNPSALFLGERDHRVPGSAVFAGMEGSRPVLVEIQALVAPSPLGTPRRAVVGWDQSRLSMVLAVLEAHCGVKLSGHDVYLNVAGGLRIQEPAADLAAAAALVSSLANAPLPADAVFFGEVSLSGAVRPVAQTAARLKEAQKLGFGRAVMPEASRAEGEGPLTLETVSSLSTLVADIAARGSRPARPERRAANEK